MGGEPSNLSVAGRTEWDLHRWSSPQPCVPQPERCVASVYGGCVLKCGVWRADPGRRLLLTVRRQPEGMEVRKSATRNACRGNPDRHRSEAPLLSDLQGAGLPLQPLSPHEAPASLGTRKGSHRGRSSCDPGRCCIHIPLLPGADLCAPGQPREQTPVGGPHAEVVLKPQLSPRGCATKEEKLKSLLAAALTANWQPCDQLCKLSACRTSKWAASAPAAKMGLALAAVGFVGTYTGGSGQARVWAAPIVHTAGPDPWLLQSWDLTSVDLCWWPGENNIWGTLGPTAGIPMVKVGTRTVPTTV